MVAHSLHRHSQSLMNELEHMAHRVIQEIIKNQYSPSGPTLGSHTEEAALYSRPVLPFSFAAPKPPNLPIYVSTRSAVILEKANSSPSHPRRSRTATHAPTSLIVSIEQARCRW